ncbi:MAG: spore protease YyaC [Lachnospiraceae bacterium]|nr:spore protease YyaC [Lachnospiraceae bacterium]
MNNIFATRCVTEYFDIKRPNSYMELGKYITKNLIDMNINDYTPVVLCIGTDRATGDCLGPLVGEQLINYSPNFNVLGTLSYPVHALNLRQAISLINKEVRNPFVIAVDAALGMRSHVGYISVSNCPMAPGKGVNKNLPAIGNISITGIVNMLSRNPSLLQSTRLHTVKLLADCIADALKYSIDYLEDF